MSLATDYFDMQAAPMRIGKLHLKVRELPLVSAFYQSALGLGVLRSEDRRVTLGSGETALIELSGDPTLAPNDPRQAGLFHTAFLMPTRGDLARWLAHAIATQVPLEGASDHIVSEAIYLSDPEGNGIEVYVDRPLAGWRGPEGKIRMSTDALDVQDLLGAAGDTRWAGFPAGGRIGHVHLRVGDTRRADRFYRDILGFEVTAGYPGAQFYGSGGYHHHLAGNVWHSRRADMRPRSMAGLEAVELVLRDAGALREILARAQEAGVDVHQSAQGNSLRDPWGIAITLNS